MPINGTIGNDSIDGTVGNDEINGLGGDDTLNGLAGNDTIFGGAGNDLIDGGVGDDFLLGGAGNDILDLGLSGDGTVTFDQARGGTGDDLLIGGSEGPTLLTGGAGNDTLDGSQGTSDEADYFDVGFGLDGGPVQAAGDVTGVNVNLATGIASDDGEGGVDTLIGIEIVGGSFYNDTLTGDGSDNELRARDGDDILSGGAGNDILDGGLGTDLVDYSADISGVQVDLAAGVATDGSGATDTLFGIENIIGSNLGDDRLAGDGNNNLLNGQGGNDTLFGAGGDDTLIGGAGSDEFSFDVSLAGNSIVADFDPASDIIDLSGLSGISSSAQVLELASQVGADTVFNFAGSSITLAGVNLVDLTEAHINVPLIGTDGDDTLNNTGDIVSIDVGAGNDTLLNSGTIINQSSDIREIAVRSTDGDLTVLNSGSIIAGDDRGIFGGSFDLSVAISHTSSGTLNVTNGAGGLIVGGRMAVETLTTSSGAAPGFATIINDGAIISGDDAIRARGGVDIQNSGTITGTGEAFLDGSGNPAANGSDGIAIFDAPAGTIDPNIVSTISNSSTGVIEGYRGGINFGLQGSLDNAGHIEGGDAAVLVTAANVSIANSGTIVQTNSGPQGGGLGGIELTAGIYANTFTNVDNSGTIEGVNHGIRALTAVNLDNSGTITGNSDGDGTGTAITSASLDDFLVTASEVVIPISIVANLLPADFATESGRVPVLSLSRDIGDGTTIIVPLFELNEATGFYEIQTDVNGNTLYEDVTTGSGTFSFVFDAEQGGFVVQDGAGGVAYAVPVGVDFNDQIDNEGIINGNVSLGLGDDTIFNDGAINGDVLLGSGNDFYEAEDDGTAFSVDGGAGNDTLIGGEADDQFYGGTGADTFVVNGDSSDSIFDFSASDGDILDLSEEELSFYGLDDVLASASEENGVTVIDLGDGNSLSLEGVPLASLTVDNFVFAPNNPEDNDEIEGTKGDDDLDGGIGHDTLGGGKGSDSLDGGSGNDLLFGDKGNDTLDGGRGRDMLDGGKGNDQINGGAGNDVLVGGKGRDELNGGEGNDTLEGGKGNDLFVFTGASGEDVVTDFSIHHDTLDISGTSTDFTDLASVEAAATETSVGGIEGLLIDLGAGNSVFLQGLDIDDLKEADVTF